MKSGILLVIPCLGAFALASCNSQPSNSSANQNGGDTAKISASAPTASVTTSDDDDALPNLLQIGSIIKSSNLNYMPGLTNPVASADNYNTTYQQNLNLGIYVADLAYCTLNKKNEESMNYLNTVKSLADKIGIGILFESGSFFNRYKANLNNEDSLAGLVADLQMKVDDLLKKNNENSVRVVIYSGAWIENMYIAAEVCSKSKNSAMGVHLIEQMTILENMLTVLNKYQNTDPHIKDLYTNLKQVDDTYKTFDEIKNYNPDSKTPFAFSDDHLKQLTGLLEGLHAKYIK